MELTTLTFFLTMALGALTCALAFTCAQVCVEVECRRIRRAARARSEASFRLTGRRCITAAQVRALRLSLPLETRRPTFSARTGLCTAPDTRLLEADTEPSAPLLGLGYWTGLRPHTDGVATMPGVVS